MTSMGDNIKYLNNYLQYEELFVMKVLNRQEKLKKIGWCNRIKTLHTQIPMSVRFGGYIKQVAMRIKKKTVPFNMDPIQKV